MADLAAMEGRLDKSYLKRGSGKKGASDKGRNAIPRNVTPPKRSAPKEVKDERRGFWHGEMCTHLRYQEREPGFKGFYRCMCGDPECHAEIEGFDEARRFFQPGHLKSRASFRTKGFRFGYLASLGPDDPWNVVPVTPDCNRKEFWRRESA